MNTPKWKYFKEFYPNLEGEDRKFDRTIHAVNIYEANDLFNEALDAVLCIGQEVIKIEIENQK